MNYSFYLARKLSLSAGKHKNTPAVKVAVTAVALSVAVMLAAIAIVVGFKKEIRAKVTGFNSHMTMYVAPTAGDADNTITLIPTLRKILDDTDFITDYSLEISIPAILKTSDNFKGVYLRSLEGSTISNFIKSNLEEGALPDYTVETNSQKIVISRLAANQLGLSLGDKIDTYFISDDVRVRRMEIAGIYNSHFDNYDKVLIFGSLGMVQTLAGLTPTQGSTIMLSTDNFENVDLYTGIIQNRLMEGTMNGELYKYYRVDNARNQGAGYFAWLELLDTNVIVVLVLMAFVAIATLISGMLILILDKQRFIGLQRALGLSSRRVRRVFVYLAMKIALIGMLIGNAIMLSIIYLQRATHILPLDPDSYYIDFVPMEISWQAILILNITVLIFIYIGLVLPSRFAAKISPARVLTQE